MLRRDASFVGMLAGAMACLAVAAGCGDADTADAGRDGAGATPEAPSTDDVRFDDLPRFPRSEPFGTQSEQGEVVTQSFRARGASVERVVEFYRTALEEAGWASTEPVHRDDGPGRADWVSDGYRLELSAIDVSDRARDSADEAVVQYSLVLRPE